MDYHKQKSNIIKLYESKDITFYSAYKYIYRAQNFRFSLSFNFGKMDTEVKKARRGIQNNDLKSIDESVAGAVQQ